jgi:AcrR family transcriptional regulator
MATRREVEWRGEDKYARRHELYVRAVPVFRRDGYRGSTLKALAAACGLSIPGLYRYFPSKRAFALFPLRTLYPELHPPEPDVTAGDPIAHLAHWIDAAADELPYVVLAVRMAFEAGLSPVDEHRSTAALAAHTAVMADLIRRAEPRLREDVARQIATTMIEIAAGGAVTGLAREPDALRRDLRALLRGYGISVPTRSVAAA